MDLIEKIRGKIPKYVEAVAGQLRQNDFEAYLVGGSVRDLVLGRQPQDYDIATNATPEQVTQIFPKSVPTGAQFGTIRVLVENEERETVDIEVTTYRSEADYFGGRWPAKVEFAKNIEDDLARRDFTMNAIAVRLDGSLDEADIADPFGGVEDIKNKIVRAVGDPVERFTEDGLRPIRACRLAANLGFTMEEKTFEAIKQTLTIIDNISAERVRDELNKLLLKSPKPSVGFEYLRKSGILEIILPELLEGIDVVQPEFHSDDVYTHTLQAVDIAEDSVKLAALFHDIAKPRTRSEDEKGIHFYGHDVMGAEMTSEIMRRLKYSKEQIDRTTRLVRWHMFYYPNADWRKKYTDSTYLSDEELEVVRQEQESQDKQLPGGWSDAAVRRFIKNVGGEDLIDDLMKLRIADASANGKTAYNPEELVVLAERIAKVRAQEMALKVTDLDVGGLDMQELGLKGAQIGRMLNLLLEEVIEEPKHNDKQILLELAKKHLPEVLK